MAATSGMVKVFVSTIPGLEFICVGDCNEVFGARAKKEGRGRVSFSTAIESLPQLCKLKSVHHFWLEVFQSSEYLRADVTKERTLENFEKLAESLEWSSAIYALNYFKTNELSSIDSKENSVTTDENEDVAIPSSILDKESAATINSLKRKREQHLDIERTFSKDFNSDTTIENTLSTSNDKSTNWTNIVTDSENGNDNGTLEKRFEAHNELLTFLRKKPSDIKFRVTCNRTGKHGFTSMEAAKYLGSGVKGYFGWSVDLENYDIEILAFIEDQQVSIAIKLSMESKHNRNVKYFGPTTLRATTSYCMLKLAGVKPGDVICDPMCGTGSICLEGINSFPSSFHLGGELHPEGCQNARSNLDHIESSRKSGLPFDVLSWDACRLPLRDGLLDVIICDLPFGKRIGYKGRNFALYPAVLNEMARVCRYKGKAVLLTQHKSAMNKALKSCNRLWKKQGTFFMNMGGLNAGIYILKKIAH